MARVLPFSQTFPAYHLQKGDPTYFVEKFWNSFNVEAIGETFIMDYSDEVKYNLNKKLNLTSSIIDNFLKNLKNDANSRMALGIKNHTIREGHRWKAGDYFSPRVWSGKPYWSKQIIIAPDTLITNTWDFELTNSEYLLKGKKLNLKQLTRIAVNDGLSCDELELWFQKPFKGQIICWNKSIKY